MNINRKYISDIKRGKRWKHISDLYNIDKGKFYNNKIHSINMKNLIKNLLSDGYQSWEIIEKLNLPDDSSHKYLIQNIKGMVQVSTSTTIESEPEIEEELIYTWERE